MRSNAKKRQYTVRSIPEYVDTKLKEISLEQNKSLNQVVLDILIRGIQPDGIGPSVRRDLSFMHHSLTKRQSESLEKELNLQRKIDEDLWT